MSAHYSEEELQTIFQPPKIKIATMVEVIDKVKKV